MSTHGATRWLHHEEGQQLSGPKPICRGCNGEIDCDAACFWHRWTDICTYDEHIDQFHCKARCVLDGMNLMNLGLFMNMKWGDSKQGKLVKAIEKLQAKREASKK